MVKYVKTRQPTRRELRKLERPQLNAPIPVDLPPPTTIPDSISHSSMSSSSSSSSVSRTKKERSRRINHKERLLPRARKRGGRHKPIVVLPDSASPPSQQEAVKAQYELESGSVQYITTILLFSPPCSSESETTCAVRTFRHRVKSSISKMREETQRLQDIQVKELLGDLSDPSKSDTAQRRRRTRKKRPQRAKALARQENEPPGPQAATRGPAALLFATEATQGQATSRNSLDAVFDKDDPFVVSKNERPVLQNSSQANVPSATQPSQSQSATKPEVFNTDTSNSLPRSSKQSTRASRKAHKFVDINAKPTVTTQPAQPDTGTPAPPPTPSSSSQRIHASESYVRLGLAALGNMKIIRPGETIGSLLASSSSTSLMEAVIKSKLRERRATVTTYTGPLYECGRVMVAGPCSVSSSAQLTSPPPAGCSAWFRRSPRGSRMRGSKEDIEMGRTGTKASGGETISEDRPGGEISVMTCERSVLSRATFSLVRTVATAFLSPWRRVELGY